MRNITQRDADAALRRVRALFWIVLIFGVFLRVWNIANVPSGLNQDEASMGYDAWAILRYGIDRNGTALPVHMIAWGCGQNALYAYLSMPFIAVFGLNAFSIRLVSALLASLTLPVAYLILKRFAPARTALIGMGLLAISPWHIMLSRWGLEANILPAMFAFALFFMVKALDKPGYFIPASLLFSLALYAYAPSYCVIPVFYGGAFLIFWFKKTINRKILTLGAVSFVLVAIPILLFVLTNFFKWGDIHIGPLTAPQISASEARFSSAMSGGSLVGRIDNFYQNVILQRDWTTWNTLEPYGVFYVISLPFTLLGIVSAWTKRTPLTYLLSGWLGAGLLLFVLMRSTNINRVNIVFLPLILFAAMGLADVMKRDWKRILAIVLTYCILFTGFATGYVKQYVQEQNSAFYADLGEAIQKANEAADADDTIYVTTEINMPYIFVLFYTQIPPREYLETVQIEDYEAEFRSVSTFGRYVFDTGALEASAPGLYIIPAYHAETYAQFGDEVFYCGKYIVMSITE